jgi:hypothetical protein
MTLGDLLSLARTLLRDKQEPYFWSDAELTEFANEAVDEACTRARLIETKFNLAVLPGVDQYTVPANIQRITQVDFIRTEATTVAAGAFTLGSWYTIAVPGSTNFTLLGAVDSLAGTPFQATGVGAGTGTAYKSCDYRLHALSQAQLSNAVYCGVTPSAVPVYFASGDNANDIRVFPTPNATGGLIVNVRRLPLAAERMGDISDEPAISEAFHHDLVYWMLAAAYNVDVADTKSDTASEKNEAKFEARFGRRPTARGETQGRRSVVGSNVYPHRFGS